MVSRLVDERKMERVKCRRCAVFALLETFRESGLGYRDSLGNGRAKMEDTVILD